MIYLYIYIGGKNMIKPFMRNPCNHPNCASVSCNKCFFYKPMIFNIRVPKIIGNILFKLEEKLMRY